MTPQSIHDLAYERGVPSAVTEAMLALDAKRTRLEAERDELRARLTALEGQSQQLHIDHVRFGGYCEKHVALVPCKKCQDAAAGAAPVPIDKVLVPVRMTIAMQRVCEQDDWEWADVLVAANAVTESQYESALAGVAPVPEGWRLVKRDDLEELHASINGDCYRGQEWEIEAIEAMLTPKEQP